MFDDYSTVRVARYVRRHTSQNPSTKLNETRSVHVDWGIGEIDGGNGLFVYGPPFQIYTLPYGTPMAQDSNVLVAEEVVSTPFLPSTSAFADTNAYPVHFKFPGV